MFEIDGCERRSDSRDAIDEWCALIDDDDAFAPYDAQTTTPLACVGQIGIEGFGAHGDVRFVCCAHQLFEEPSEVHASEGTRVQHERRAFPRFLISCSVGLHPHVVGQTLGGDCSCVFLFVGGWF